MVVKDYFSKTGAVWFDPEELLYRQQIKDIIRFSEPKNKVILDAGVGKGRLAISLAFAGAKKVVGVDLSKKMLAIAARRAKKAGIADKIILEHGDIEQLKYKCETFDTVCCLETFVHLPNPQRAMNELARVCRYGGLVIADADFVFRQKKVRFSNLRSILGKMYLSKPLYPLRLLAFRLLDMPLAPIPKKGIYRVIPKKKFNKYFKDANLKIEKVIHYDDKRTSGFMVVYAKKMIAE